MTPIVCSFLRHKRPHYNPRDSIITMHVECWIMHRQVKDCLKKLKIVLFFPSILFSRVTEHCKVGGWQWMQWLEQLFPPFPLLPLPRLPPRVTVSLLPSFILLFSFSSFDKLSINWSTSANSNWVLQILDHWKWDHKIHQKYISNSPSESYEKN